MFAAECPRCNDRVSLPSGTPPEATVQCPLCKEEFELSEVYDALPPALVVIKVPESAAAATTESSSGPVDFATPEADDGDEYTFAPEAEEESSSAGAFSFDAGESDSSPAASLSKGSISARPRSKKPAVNPVKEIVKVAFGGIAGVMIAIILLWYLPGRYGQDLLGIGPTIGSIPVVGGIVPAKFRGKGSQTNSESDPSIQGDDSPFLRVEDEGPRPSGISDFAPKNQGNQNRNKPNNNGGASNNTPERLEGGFAVDEPEAGDPFDVTADPLAVPDLDVAEFDPIAGLDPTVETPASPEVAEPEPAPMPSEVASTEDSGSNNNGPKAPGGKPLGPKKQPEVTAEDLATSVKQVKQNEVEYAGSFDLPGAERRAVAEGYYNSFAELAQDITFLDKTDPALDLDIQDTAQLLEALGSVPQTMTIMQYFASEDLRKPESSGKGVLMLGKVTALGASNGLYLSKIDIDSTGKTPREYTVVLANDPTATTPQFKPGAQVALLGTIVTDPAENLRGYKGKLPVAVWSGYYVLLETDA